MVANKNSNVSSGQRHPLSKWGNDDVDLISNINWLGREGSNLRMAESKSAGLYNDFKAHLEKMVETHSSNFNRLAAVSK